MTAHRLLLCFVRFLPSQPHNSADGLEPLVIVRTTAGNILSYTEVEAQA
jgi:hypothetical protein